MAGPEEMGKINEKLYTDSYFRLLKNKSNSKETASTLRDLIRQVKLISVQQNISEIGSEKLKSEMLTEYSNIIDSENHPGLLSVNKDPETYMERNKSDSRIHDALKDFNSYLNSLNINLPSSKQLPMNSISKPLTSNYGSSTVAVKQNIFRPQNKYSSSSLPNKRTSTETEDSHPGFSAKRSYNNKMYNKQKTCSPSSNEKSKASAFVSASSMYRNPLKKAVQEESKTEDHKSNSDSEQSTHESLKHFDKKIVDVIFNEIMDFSPNIKWTDIAGLDFVKTTVQEIVIWPLLRPDIFTGLRAPPRGILLFGPPGTGKTLIGKCIATESNSTFFCISASSLASKWVGESEQLVRALFTVARINQPAVIFIDEIDSLLSQRSDKDQDFTRKLKTEFLVQFDGAKTNSEERILVVGATNRPHELDEAARRRFVKRLYVPLPDRSARRQIVEKLLGAHQHNLSESDLQKICDETDGYSGSDVAHLCKEAAMGPIRCIGPEDIKTVSLDQVRSILLVDFLDALRQVRASVAQDDLNYYLDWNKKFGSFGVGT